MHGVEQFDVFRVEDFDLSMQITHILDAEREERVRKKDEDDGEAFKEHLLDREWLHLDVVHDSKRDDAMNGGHVEDLRSLARVEGDEHQDHAGRHVIFGEHDASGWFHH